jgi:small subunit ribosomal protein S15
VQARYRGVGTDLSRVAQFKAHEKDVGSAPVQIAQLTARIQQLTGHLQQHRKDFSTRRGLEKMLASRKSLMQYLQKIDSAHYESLIKELGIRPLKIQAGRNVVIKLQSGAVPEKVAAVDAAVDI